VKHRVFFLDERTARAVGYRPCAICMPEKYQAWKIRAGRKNRSAGRARSK